MGSKGNLNAQCPDTTDAKNRRDIRMTVPKSATLWIFPQDDPRNFFTQGRGNEGSWVRNTEMTRKFPIVVHWDNHMLRKLTIFPHDTTLEVNWLNWELRIPQSRSASLRCFFIYLFGETTIPCICVPSENELVRWNPNHTANSTASDSSAFHNQL